MASIHNVRFRLASLVLTAAVMLATPFAGGVHAQELDPTFNAEITSDGLIALQSDGKVLVAGSAQDMGQQAVVARFNTDGTLDRSFNFNLGANDLGRTLATINVQGDGRILVGGMRLPFDRPPLVRLMPDGSLDPSFNFALFGSVYTAAVQPDGKILVGGFFTDNINGDLITSVHRVNTDGSLDTGFSTNVAGTVVRLALQPSGKIIITGLFLLVDNQTQAYMARLNANGSLDSSFDVPDLGFGSAVGPLAVRPDGRIVATLVFADFINPPRYGIFQLGVDGGIDPAFNTVIDDTTGGVTKIVIQPDGKALIAGWGRFNQVRTSCMTRLLPDGNVDLTIGIGNDDCRAGDVALQSDGKILASGNNVPRGLSRYLPAIPESTEADLRLVKTASTGAMTNGGTVDYTLKLTNLGTVDAAGIIVTDTIPTGLTFNSCFSSHLGLCAGLGNQRTVTFGALAPQETATITITANVTPAAAATVQNVASVTSYSSDPVTSNNSSSANSYRNPPQLADLALTKTANRTLAAPGDTLTYTLSVHNNGPNAATSVTVTDTLPAGVTVTSCSASGGSCTGSNSARTITYDSIPSGSTRTITIAVRVDADGGLLNTATVGSTTQDPDSANNAASVTTASETDEDSDGLPNEWERRFGLRPGSSTGSDGRLGDPDNDGLTNIEEFTGGTHPRGFFKRFLAEGAANSFFDVRIAILNVSTRPAKLLRRYLQPGGAVVSKVEELAPGRRRTLTLDDLTDLNSPDFSTVIESDEPLVVDRTMTWGGGYGSHAETGVPGAATTWYLAEGSTSGDFSLFYLIQNPNPGETTATIRYLLPFGQPPIEKTYTLAGNSRTTIAVDGEGPELALTDVSAVISAPAPIIVERAMYKDSRTRAFAAGHGSAGVTATSTHWFLAEGATGPFFDCFVLLANPGTTPANVTIDYLLSDGRTFTKSYAVPAQGRFTVWVDNEEIPGGSGLQPLDNVAVSSEIMSDVPIIVERTMWWPSPAMAADFWIESHNSPGATQTGIKWALAEGEVGGPQSAETYILIANTSAFAGSAQVTLYFEDGTSATKPFELQPRSRLSVNTSAEFPEAIGRRFGAVIESLGTKPAQIVVERAMYTSPGGETWTAGTNALAARVQ